MEPLALLAIIDAALTIIERVEPEIAKAVQKGDVTIEEQQARLDRLNALRDRLSGYYSGPEMKLSTEPRGPGPDPIGEPGPTGLPGIP